MDWMTQIDHRLFDVAVMLASTFLFGWLVSRMHVPRVTGYIFAGLLLGPSLADWLGYPSLLDNNTLLELDILNEVALGLIVFTIGREFSAANLRKLGWPLLWITLTQAAFVLILTALACGIVMWVRSDAVSRIDGLYAGLLLGLIAIATAPSATLLVLREYDSEGPVTDHLLAMVGLTNVLCIFLSTTAISAWTGMQGDGTALWVTVSTPLGKLMLSIILGAALGFCISYAQAKNLERMEAIILVFVAVLLGIGLSKAWGCDALLTCLTTGIVHANSAVRGKEYFTHLRTVDLPFYMIFFFLTGANMHLELLWSMWPLVLVFSVARAAGKVFGTLCGCWVTHRTETLRHYLGYGMLSQAGVAIGLAYAAVEAGVPQANMIKTVVLASTVLFEIVGPLAVKGAIVGAAEVKVVKLLSPFTGTAWRSDLGTVIEQLRESLGIPHWRHKSFAGEVQVQHVMRKNAESVPEDAKFNEILRTLEHSRYTRLPVISAGKAFVGMVALEDLRDVVFDPAMNSFIIARDLAVMPGKDEVAYADEPIRDLVGRFERAGLQLLPVLQRENHFALEGIVTQRDVLTAAFEQGSRQTTAEESDAS